MSDLKWAYGVTTVPSRFGELLPKTLASLEKAGFDQPRLFIDGCKEIPTDLSSKYQVTNRWPTLRTHGNWVLSMYELFIRSPRADRYAIFQDDFVTYPHLREYLDACEFPEHGYWNLYTFPQNQKETKGWYLSNQLGKGAVALVFSNEGVRTLLCQRHLLERPMDSTRGHRSVDGGIVTAMKREGWKEWVHNPSLVQHTGLISSMGNRRQELSPSFQGEDWDPRQLLSDPEVKLNPAAHLPKVVIGKPAKGDRIGLVGYNAPCGLGELNRQIATHCDVDTWLVKPHNRLASLQPHPDVDTISCPSGKPAKLNLFLDRCDTVVICETQYYGNLVSLCRERGKRVVCVPMLEWMTAGCKSWPKLVDLFLCPTQQAYQAFAHVIPCVYFPWPTDLERFKFNQRTTVEKFVFINGTGGWSGRKGGDVVRRAKELWPEMPLIVYTQSRGEDWGPDTTVVTGLPENQGLYAEGDVLLYPSSVDGLGLQPIEAACCGMPVISTAGQPWNEYPFIGQIEATSTKRKVARPVDWYTPSAESLVAQCQHWLGKSITQESRQARQWAENRSWTTCAAKFNELVRRGTPQ